jgi:phenylpropionate dioxygenase-like ring-hydroxylating dioxygenase large terminal subunit
MLVGPRSQKGDNPAMSSQSTWHPVMPAAGVRAGGAVVAARVQDQRLALWRGTSGTVQAWDDRCPHRGVALSLGRVLGDRLACAYHGWEYAEGSGRCIAIPAMPQQPVPGKVCVATHAALEQAGMVWVAPGAVSPPGPPPSAQHDTPAQFLRSMAVAAPHATVEAALAEQAFTSAGPCQWRGHCAGHGLYLWLLDAAADWCMLHVASTTTRPGEPTPPALLFHALRILRDRLQTAPP